MDVGIINGNGVYTLAKTGTTLDGYWIDEESPGCTNTKKVKKTILKLQIIHPQNPILLLRSLNLLLRLILPLLLCWVDIKRLEFFIRNFKIPF